MDCIFCKIINGQIPSKIIDSSNNVIVIQDLHPKAPVHYLIIPKKHIENLSHLEESDFELAADMLFMAQKLSKNLSGSQAFKLIFNNGFEAGQRVFHSHGHFLAGKVMED